MAYGSLVVQLIQDYEDYAEVNKQLEKMQVSRRIFLYIYSFKVDLTR
jgi:hypothetical protein